MDMLKAIRSRRSVRKYKADMVPQELLDKVIEAGVWSATGRNQQAPIIVAVTNREIRDKLSAVNREIGGFPAGMDPFYGAPVVLIVLAEKNWPTHVYDGSLVIGNMMLEAHELGLGSCWIHRAKEEFEMPEWKSWLESLGVQGEYEGIGHLILGYPDESPADKPRKENWVYYAK